MIVVEYMVRNDRLVKFRLEVLQIFFFLIFILMVQLQVAQRVFGVISAKDILLVVVKSILNEPFKVVPYVLLC